METEKRKLTEKQLRIVQFIAGVLAAAVLMVSIVLSPALEGLLQYLFVAVFIVITLGRRWVENRYRLRLNFFNLVMVVSIMIGIFILLLQLFYFPTQDAAEAIKLGDTEKLLITIGAILVILVLGFVLPIRMYLKRKEKGTLIPIRIPEKTEEENREEERKISSGGRPSISQQMADMQRELDEKEREQK